MLHIFDKCFFALRGVGKMGNASRDDDLELAAITKQTISEQISTRSQV